MFNIIDKYFQHDLNLKSSFHTDCIDCINMCVHVCILMCVCVMNMCACVLVCTYLYVWVEGEEYNL